MENMIYDKETLNAIESTAYQKGYLQGIKDANKDLMYSIETAFRRGQMFENDACAKLFSQSELANLIRQRMNHEIT